MGYWVYVYPYWYIWRDLAAACRTEAAVPPGPGGRSARYAAVPGDQATAWASETPDGQVEWLELEYAEPVVPSGAKGLRDLPRRRDHQGEPLCARWHRGGCLDGQGPHAVAPPDGGLGAPDSRRSPDRTGEDPPKLARVPGLE